MQDQSGTKQTQEQEHEQEQKAKFLTAPRRVSSASSVPMGSTSTDSTGRLLNAAVRAGMRGSLLLGQGFLDDGRAD